MGLKKGEKINIDDKNYQKKIQENYFDIIFEKTLK